MATQVRITALEETSAKVTPSRLRRIGRLIRRKPLGAISAALILVWIVAAALADQSPHDPISVYKGLALTPPGVESPKGVLVLGGDHLGRDLFTRILYGARTALTIGVSAIMLGTSTGCILGLISGYMGGKTDLIIQRIMDAKQAIPTLILAMFIMSVLGAALINVIITIAIVLIPNTNRVVRGSVLSAKENVYVEAATVIGCTRARIMFRHILPNVTAPIIILATVELGSAILIEASLSFLGMGTPPPTPSWGAMLSESGRQYMLRDPKLLFYPGLALSSIVLSYNLAGDALRDIWDPRLRGR